RLHTLDNPLALPPPIPAPRTAGSRAITEVPELDWEHSPPREKFDLIEPKTLRELEQNFDATRNPVFVFMAIRLLEEFGLDFPTWIRQFIVNFSVQVCEISTTNDKDQRKKDSEATTVGKVLGFSTGGAGKTGMFKKAGLWRRDIEIYRRVCDYLERGDKLD